MAPNNKTNKTQTLDEDAQQMLTESFNSQQQWKQKGEIQFKPPNSLVAGRIVIELFPKESPKTVENFKALCTGEKGNSKLNKEKKLHYKGCPFHRIIKGFMCQGGDLLYGDGRGGESIFGKKFNDEKGGLALHHGKGFVSMANSGKNSNTSQFFITFADRPTLDKKHTVFGKVIDGFEVLQEIEDRAASDDGTPLLPVKIHDCGIL